MQPARHRWRTACFHAIHVGRYQCWRRERLDSSHHNDPLSYVTKSTLIIHITFFFVSLSLAWLLLMFPINSYSDRDGPPCTLPHFLDTRLWCGFSCLVAATPTSAQMLTNWLSISPLAVLTSLRHICCPSLTRGCFPKSRVASPIWLAFVNLHHLPCLFCFCL
jgi:hypothetical protein